MDSNDQNLVYINDICKQLIYKNNEIEELIKNKK